MRDARIVTLYKSKGERGNKYRSISIVGIVGKLCALVVLVRLRKPAERVHTDPQCAHLAERATVDMIFSLR